MPLDHSSTAAHVAFAGRLSGWLRRAGVPDDAASTAAVGFADILNAAGRAAPELEAMLELDPSKPEEEDKARGRLCYLHAIFLTEIKDHVDALATHWEAVEAPLLATAPDDDDES